MTTNSILITICHSQDINNRAELEVPTNELSLERLMKIGNDKLKLKKIRGAYVEKGDELKDPKDIKSGDWIYFSDGRTIQSSHEVIHLCMLGSGAVGKSALTLQFIQNKFVADYDPTIEDAYRKPVSVDESPLLLDILDTAGQEDFIALRTSWMKDKDGFVLVFSIVHHKSFDDLRGFYESLCEVYDDKVPPFILVGNKADLDNPEVLASNPEKYRREVSREEALETARKWGAIKYIETSALTGQNVQSLYGALVRDIISVKIPQEQVEEVKEKKWWEKCVLL